MRAASPVGGVHDQTSALRDVLLAAGYTAPHTEQPPSEALLLGLGGGLGAAVFTFHYQGHLPHLYVETRCHTQYAYTLDFVQRAAAGLGLSVDVHTTGGAKAAARRLDEALAARHPALLLVDALSLPHLAMPGEGYGLPWLIVAHEQDGDDVVLTDRSHTTFRMPRADLDRARARYKKGKHALGTLAVRAADGRPVVEERHALGEQVRAAVGRCVAELSGASARKGFERNFGLPALQKWRDEVAATTKKGWRKSFPAGPALAAGLRQAYAWVETNGTGGGGFRRMYAEFLREGAEITGDGRFAEAADAYAALATQWTEGFAALLPDGTALGDIRAKLHERADAVQRGAPAADQRAIDTSIDTLVASCEAFPVDAERTYVQLAEHLDRLVEGERAACALLGTCSG